MNASLVKIFLLSAIALSLLSAASCGSKNNKYISEGTLASPIDAKDVPVSRESKLGKTSSYYKANTTTTGTYIVTISGMKEDADLYVYGNADFSTDVKCVSVNSASTETCEADFTSTTIATPLSIYVRVKAVKYKSGTKFTLKVIKK